MHIFPLNPVNREAFIILCFGTQRCPGYSHGYSFRLPALGRFDRETKFFL